MKHASIPVSGQKRWQLLDILRGAAVIAMIFYHAIWNLGYFRIISSDFLYSISWKLSGGVIAASFLIISGISLTLAHSGGFRRNIFIKRLARIGGGALLVTAVTWYMMPDSFIFFGILHCLAVSSILALPFLKWPRWAGYLAIVLVLIAPLLFNQALWDNPWLDWLGFGRETPLTNDYVPIFPWFAFVLIGLLIGGSSLVGRLEAPANGVSKALAFTGRWSLLIYLLHQPILFGATLAAVRSGAIEVRMSMSDLIRQQCESGCMQSAGSFGTCRAMCSCTVDQLTGNPKYSILWQRLQEKDTSSDMQQQVVAIARSCANPANRPENPANLSE